MKLFRKLDADALGAEKVEELRLVFEVRARGVAEAEARALIALMEELRKLRGVVAGDAQLFAHALVPEFGERFGRLDREAVEVQIVGVVVRAEKLLRVLARSPPDCDELERDHVNAPRIAQAHRELAHDRRRAADFQVGDEEQNPNHG